MQRYKIRNKQANNDGYNLVTILQITTLGGPAYRESSQSYVFCYTFIIYILPCQPLLRIELCTLLSQLELKDVVLSNLSDRLTGAYLLTA